MQNALAHRLTEHDADDAASSSENRLPVAERRRYVRFKLRVGGRFMREDKQEFACSVADISVGAAALETTAVVRPGERIVAYLDNLGGVEGTVFRLFEGGFILVFSISSAKRERLAAQLTLLVNADELDADDLRRKGHERVKVVDKATTVTLDDGSLLSVVLGDVSVSGALLHAEVKPPLGTLLTVGRLRSKVVRHHPSGFAVQFQNRDGSDIISILTS